MSIDIKKRSKRVLVGRVVSDKMDKSITVLVEKTVKHKQYSKFIKRRAKFCAHDENNSCGFGDLVEVVECKPLSKRKSWRLRAILEKAKG